jgi:GNAT superfamily N-acetyltransferase
MEFRPFEERWLEDAGRHLAAMHRRARALEPALPARFDEAGAARAAVESVWRKPGASGVAAFNEGRLLAYLIGSRQVENQRGRHVWIGLPGSAVVEGGDPGVLQDLYAQLAMDWAEQGYFDHYAMVYAHDRALVDTWFALSFGREQVDALRESGAVTAPLPTAIRRAGPDDLDRILAVADVIDRHQAGSPVFGAFLPESNAGHREGLAEVLADAGNHVFLAMEGVEVLGALLMEPRPPSDEDLLAAERCVELAVALTRPDQRGRGIGTALTAAALAWAQEAGYRTVATDWRSTNLLASRFWPRRGFRPTAYRLVRRVDPRVAWAKGLSSH